MTFLMSQVTLLAKHGLEKRPDGGNKGPLLLIFWTDLVLVLCFAASYA